jgi:hypothetical protein
LSGIPARSVQAGATIWAKTIFKQLIFDFSKFLTILNISNQVQK